MIQETVEFFLCGTLPKWKHDEGSIIHAISRNQGSKEKRFDSPYLSRLKCGHIRYAAIDLPFYFESENNGTKRNGALRGVRAALKRASGNLAGAGGLVLHRHDRMRRVRRIVLALLLILSHHLGAPFLRKERKGFIELEWCYLVRFY